MKRMKRFPHYKQLEVSDCGPTSLRMIAKYYGMDYSTEMLRKHCHISRRGVNMLGISEGARHIGLDAVGVKMTFSQLAENGTFPCILHWNQNHFVVCYGVERQDCGRYKIRISDPASQRLAYTREEFERCWIGPDAGGDGEGVALMLEPGDRFGEVEDEYKKNRRSLLSFAFYFTPLPQHDMAAGACHDHRKLDTNGAAFPFASNGRPGYQRTGYECHHTDTPCPARLLCRHIEHRLYTLVDNAPHELAHRHSAHSRFPHKADSHALAVFRFSHDG